MGTTVARVLITGASGHLGHKLAARLVGETDIVLGVDIRHPFDYIPGVVFEKCDITRPGWLRSHIEDYRIDTVVHLAWDRGQWSANPEHANIMGTQNVLLDLVGSAVSRLVFASSESVYGYIPRPGLALRENTELAREHGTAEDRHLVRVEHLLAEFRESYPGVTQTVFRFAPILGEGSMEPSVAMLRNGHLFKLEGHTANFGFIAAEDAVNALATGTTSTVAGIFNAAGEGTVTTEEIGEILGKEIHEGNRKALEKFIRKQEQRGRAVIMPEELDMCLYRPKLICAAMRTNLGFRPRATSLEALTAWAGH